tara:strand:+ start:274 stop:738 length:465 start_codon:yes stop_codon:yes gene_type:complete
MIKINTISNNKKWSFYIKNPKNFVQKKIKNLNKRFKKFKNIELFCTLYLSDDNEIKKLNKKFRKKNKTTDVLSFPFYNKKELKFKLKTEKEIYLGDIIVNLNKIRNKKDKISFKLEFNKTWIHGLLHLFGYDHIKNKDFKNMLRIEKKFLSYLD